jgi:hypothetical protein
LPGARDNMMQIPHPCAPNNFRRYRTDERHARPIGMSMDHIGFRCIICERRTS